jgi:hypothetical protein
MKVDESVIFDFLNPDFSCLNDQKVKLVLMKSEHQFYFKHRIIHLFNQFNEKFNPEINFENISLTSCLIGHNFRATSTYGIGKSAGNIQFNYDSYGNFEYITFTAEYGLYDNSLKFPDLAHLIRVDINLDSKNEIKDYLLERNFYTDNDDEFTFYYYMDSKHNSIRGDIDLSTNDYSIRTSYETPDDEFCLFNNFLSKNLATIHSAFPIFLEFYPYFEYTQLDTNDKLSHFYFKMKELYDNGIFDDGFDENLNVMKMSLI